MNNKNRKDYFNIVLLLLLFALLGYFIIFAVVLTIKQNTKEVAYSMNYNEAGSLKYETCLNDNDYLDSNCTSDSKSFVTAMIDKFKINLDYQLDLSDLSSNDINYKIIANVTATEKYNEDKILYNKDEEIINDKISNSNVNFVKIDKKYDIDYKKYNDIITSFKKDYVVALDSKLTLTATIDVIGKNDNTTNNIVSHYTMAIVLPLAETTVNIEEENTSFAHSDMIVEYVEKEPLIKEYVVMCAVLYGCISVNIICIIFIFTRLIPRKKQYEKEITKILRTYDETIVTVKKKPDLKGLKINDVSNFNELLDAYQVLSKPIIHYESSNKDYSIFVIVSDNMAYRFIISAYKKAVNYEKK